MKLVHMLEPHELEALIHRKIITLRTGDDERYYITAAKKNGRGPDKTPRVRRKAAKKS